VRTLSIAIILLGLSLILLPSAPRAQWKTHWSYEGADGPDHWGDLDPDYAPCKTGREQSPIDIRATKKTQLPPIWFTFRNGPVRIINNGYTAVRLDYDKGNGNYLNVGDKRYELTQFHFHHPSEEMIQGRSFDMVAHFMMASSEGKVAGVAVMLKAGKPNPVVEQLWKYMPATAGPAQDIPDVQVNPSGLLPQDVSYYTYMGSVTAPPCTEGVAWFVLKTPVEVSSAQINAFAKLYPHDVRPVQPLNGRVVQESQ
jgi:carbonic anhydrase